MNARIRTLLKLTLVTTALTSALPGCGGSGDSPASELVATAAAESVASNANDITNTIFVERSGDCANYADLYSASVLDIQRSLGFTASVTVIESGGACELTSNNIPNHDFNDATASFATNVAEVGQSFRIPRNAALAATPTPLSQAYYDGVMLNGVPIDLLSAGCYDPDSPQADPDGNTPIGCPDASAWLLEPLGTASGFGVDIHNAHVQPDGSYHYHGNPNAMFDNFPGPNGSPVIGFAADGFPIYGSYFYDANSGQIRKALSGYTLKTGQRPAGNDDPGGTHDGTYVADWAFTGTGDLDECNGMTVAGEYGYYVTDSYPWVINCFTGTPDPSFSK